MCNDGMMRWVGEVKEGGERVVEIGKGEERRRSLVLRWRVGLD